MYYIQSSNRVKIAVYDPNPTDKETIVMIHGWPLSHKIFEYQTGLLAACGYRVITLDLRGFGQSDAPACGYTYDQLADDVYAVVTSLNLKTFTLAGFSMGGAIALRYMGRYDGGGVKKLILLGAAAPCYTQRPDFPYGVTKESVDQLIKQAATDRPQLAVDFSQKLFAAPHSQAMIDWLADIARDATGLGTIQTAFSLRDEDCRPDLGKVHVPTGIFHGKKDKIVPFQLAQIQEQCLEDATLFAFENSGHGVFYDELDSFNHCLLDFLRHSGQ